MLQHRGSYLLDESGLRVSSIKFDRVRLKASLLLGCENLFVSNSRLKNPRRVWRVRGHVSLEILQLDGRHGEIDGREKLLSTKLRPACTSQVQSQATARSYTVTRSVEKLLAA